MDNVSRAGRFIGLDLGARRIGVAVSDPLGMVAQAYDTWARAPGAKGWSGDVERLIRLAREMGAAGVVVGLPRNMDGTYGSAADQALEFAALAREKLAELGVEVFLWDERLTTRLAERSLLEADLSRQRRRAVIDKTAAAVMLGDFLQSRNRAAKLPEDGKEGGNQ